jgi:hypothetical protein
VHALLRSTYCGNGDADIRHRHFFMIAFWMDQAFLQTKLTGSASFEVALFGYFAFSG